MTAGPGTPGSPSPRAADGVGSTGPASEPALVAQDPAALARLLPDGLLVLGPHAAEPLVVTGPSAELWALARRPVRFADVAAQLAAAHGASPEVVTADLAPVWDRLVTVGALRDATAS